MGYRHDAGERYKETRSQRRERLGIRFGQVPKKRWNPGEYRRRVRVSAGEGFEQVPKKLRASTEEGSGRVPEKVQGKYRRRVRASTENGGIRASTEEGSGRVPENGRIRASTGEGDRTRARCRGTTELKGGRDAITKAQNT